MRAYIKRPDIGRSFFASSCVRIVYSSDDFSHVSRETWLFFMIVPFHGKKIPSFSCHKVKKPGKTVEMPGGDCYNGILQTALCKYSGNALLFI